MITMKKADIKHLVVSKSGAGKSFFTKKLAIGLIRAEDDEEEMSFFRSNLRRA